VVEDRPIMSVNIVSQFQSSMFMDHGVYIYIFIHQILVASKKENINTKKYTINKSESRNKQYAI